MDRRRKSPHAQLANIWGEHFGARHVCLICVPFLQWKNKHIQRALSPLSLFTLCCMFIVISSRSPSLFLSVSLSHFWWQHKLHKFSFYFLFISFCCWSVQVQWTLFIAVVSIVVVLVVVASLLLLLLCLLLVLALLIQLFLWYAVAHSTAPSASALLQRRLCVTTTCSAPLFVPTSLPLSTHFFAPFFVALLPLSFVQ